MLDVYLNGTSSRICREAPVPVVNVDQREDVPGGAANAAVNLAALGAKPVFLTVTGDDREGRTVADNLRCRGVDTTHILFDPQRATLTKQRVLADEQLLVRFDYGTTGALSLESEAELIARLAALYGEADAVLVSDYGYGIVSDKVITALALLLDRVRKPLAVVSKFLARFAELRPSVVKPNYGETLQVLGLKPAEKAQRVEQMMEHGARMLDVTGAQVAALTVDSDGAVIVERGRDPLRVLAQPAPDTNAVGAGDTYISTFTLALAVGCDTAEAAELAGTAAGVVVRKNVTATCTAEELVAAFAPPVKILRSHSALAEQVRALRAAGKRIVFTNGCFDILHRGHTTSLSQARTFGDVLIVGVNTDAGVRRLKGTGRPVNTLEDRMVVLSALDCVDYVIAFGEDTPEKLLHIVRPDVYVKGGDYTLASLPETPIVEALGGTVEILPYVMDRSTTAVIRRINRSILTGTGD
jgi:D-beta-D-heptose 7-phosphate kinase/D-beta-D-heptose 1-phosphate adenosyltransferase